ncbi:MAG: S1 family peptidase [Solirubrobacteraceae bacterium]
MTRPMSLACLAAVLALLLSGARAQAAHPGHRAVAHAAIIGGAPAASGAFPSLAEVFDARGREVGQCSGTVVAPTLILTAGHCAENVKTGVHDRPSGFAVLTFAGAGTESERQVSRVTAVLVYEGFTRKNDDGDAALLVLSAPVSAPAVKLAGSSDRGVPAAGTTGTIAGWGKTHFRQSQPTDRLRSAGTVVQADSWCQHNAPPFFAQSELCAIDPPSYATGGCNGDSGGPLLLAAGATAEAVEVGIAVHVYGRCSTRHPTVFTSVAAILPWLDSWIAAYATRPGTPAP